MERVDTIERTVTVSSPIERVWEALTMPDQLARWFGDSAEIDLRQGGELTIGWSEYDAVVKGVIELVDPPRRFGYRWEAGEADGEMWTTKVRFTLEVVDGSTVVTVVESGLAVLPDDLYLRTLEENSSGWTAELEDLAGMLDGARSA